MIELTTDQIDILGRPNFMCSRIAWALVEGGLYAPLPKHQKSEYEQAVCIHWTLALQEKHGDQWRTEAGKELQRLAMEAALSAPMPAEPDGGEHAN